MSWHIFSTIGYASIAVWACMPMLWLLHALRRPRRWPGQWLCHIALVMGIVALVLAKVNSNSYVNRIQVDRSEQIAAQMARQQARQEKARQAAQAARAEGVAQIRFAEDAADDFLDEAGMDEADRKYMQSLDGAATPAWKMQKKQRSAGVEDDSLESLIGAIEQEEGAESLTLLEEAPPDPILMSDRDKAAADRLDAANLTLIRLLLMLACVIVVVDYLRRVHVYDEAYFPLPLPGGWSDALTPRPTVWTRPSSPRRTLLKELECFTRRGESYVYLTDDAEKAARIPTHAYRLPWHRWPVEILSPSPLSPGKNGAMDDDFVFETLW